jgi:hypothetical protein
MRNPTVLELGNFIKARGAGAVDELIDRPELSDEAVHEALYLIAFQAGLTTEPTFRAQWFPNQVSSYMGDAP